MIFLSWIALGLRLLVAAVFVTYAYGKLRRPSQFAAVIRSHRLIPNALSGVAAWGLTLLELALGILFLFNIFPLFTGIAIGVLLVLFSGILLRAHLTDQLNVRSCGCSGAIKQKATIGKALFRNVVLLCMLIPVVVTVIASRSISSSSLSLIEVAVLVCVLAGVVCLQTQLLSPILHSWQAKADRNQSEEGSVLTVTSKRRSFIGWGVKLGIGILVGAVSVGAISNRALEVFAYDCNCSCGQGGVGGPYCYDVYNCDGHIDEEVPYYRECDYYCCQQPGPGSGNYCDSSLTYLGDIYCEYGC